MQFAINYYLHFIYSSIYIFLVFYIVGLKHPKSILNWNSFINAGGQQGITQFAHSRTGERIRKAKMRKVMGFDKDHFLGKRETK